MYKELMMSKSIATLIAVVLAAPAGNATAATNEESPDIVILNDKDLQRGYVVHWGAPEMPFSSAQAVEVVIGSEEKESFELGVFALRDLGNVTLSVKSTPPLPEGSIELRTMQGISNPMGHEKFGWGLLTIGRKGVDAAMEWKDYALVDGDELEMPGGAHKSFWPIFDGRKMPPGRYVMRLRVEPEEAAPREVGLTIEVLDAPRRGEEELHLMMYHVDHFIQQHNHEVFKKHLQLMRESGQRQFRIDPGFQQHKGNVKFWWDEQGEIQADYKGIDRLLKTALEMGFDIFGWPTSGGASPNWLSEEMKALSADELEALMEELSRRFFQHIIDLGFKEIWWYCIDEPSVERATDPKFVEMLKSYTEKYPMLRPHCALNVYRPIMVEVLNPYMDIWMTDQGIVAQMERDIANGVIEIDDTDVRGPYGAGYYHHNPDGPRSTGWATAAQNITYYVYFAYGSKPAEKAHSFSCPSGSLGGMPYSTPGLEGVREGYEDRAYWQTLDVLLEGLAERHGLSPEQEEQIAAARAFRRSLSAEPPEDSLFSWRETPANEHRGFAAYRSPQAGDRWLLRRLKEPLLRHIKALQPIE